MKYVEAVFFSSVRPCAFLTKPVKPEQLQKSLRKAEELLKKEQTDYFLLRHRAKTAKIPYQDILFLESEKHRTHIHLRNGSVEYSPQKLDRLAEQFPKTFLRVHKSFLVNLSGIQKLDQGGHQFVMENGCEIMISRSYYAASKEAFFCYIRSKAFGGEKLNELL